MLGIIQQRIESHRVREDDGTSVRGTDRCFFQTDDGYRHSCRIPAPIIVVFGDVRLNDR